MKTILLTSIGVMIISNILQYIAMILNKEDMWWLATGMFGVAFVSWLYGASKSFLN